MIKRTTYSVLSALLLGLAWPEITNQSWLIFIAFIPLFSLAYSFSLHQWKSLFLYSFLSFILWHIIADYWMIYSSFLGAITAWIVNSFMMASVVSISFYSYKTLKKIPFALILSFYWLTYEFLHLFWDLMWPWMNLGNVFANKIDWIQWYEYVGIYGGSIWVIWINGLLFYVIQNNRTYRSRLAFAFLSSLLIFIPILISHHLLKREHTETSSLKISVVQPNINTYTEKFDGLSPIQQSTKIVTILEQYPKNSPLIILPETSIPENFNINSFHYPQSIQHLLNWSSKTKSDIIGGFYTYDSLNYNSSLYIHQGEIQQVRHKNKLLPFAESIPFEGFIKPLKNIIKKEGGIGSSFGTDATAKVFSLAKQPETKVGSLICFESAFPDFTSEMVRKEANFLVIITNDDWWYDSPGHLQHFAYAKLRAIENRISIARSANTGISGFINYNGQVIQKSEYNEEVILNATLKDINYLTFFTQFEVYIRWTIALIAFLILILSLLTKWFYNHLRSD